MKKALLAIFLGFALLLVPVTIFAQETTPSGKSVSAEAKARAQERRATVEAKLSLIRRERVRAFGARMITRIEAMIGRLEKLIERMDRRIAIIESSGEDIDLTQPKADVAKAKDLLEGAQAKLETAKGEIEDVIGSDDPKAAFQEVIDTVQGIKKDLIEIHTLLVHAIGDIKGLRVGTPTP